MQVKSLMVKVVLPIILIFLFTYAPAQQNQTESRDTEFYFNRGVASANKGQLDQAISDFTEVLKINPMLAPAYSNRGLVSYSKGLYDQAISDFTKALEINPRDAMTYYNRGLAYAVKGQVDQVISDCTDALEINPRLANAYCNRGVAYFTKGQYDQAISDYTKALEIDPRIATAYNNRGVAYKKKGQYDQAISDCTKALEINPRDATAYNNRGLIYSDKGQYDQAISDLTKALEIDPGYATAYNYRGIAYEKKGQLDQAISDYTKALEINPRYADAYKNRQVAYEKKGQHDRTISDGTKAHRGEYPEAKSNTRIRKTHYVLVGVAVLICFKFLLQKLLTSREWNRLLKCKTCGSPLVDGPYVERHGGNDHFKCTVKGIPTKVCPNGCPGTYWYQRGFSDEVVGAISEDSESIVGGKSCRRCNGKLTDKGQRAQFVFHQKLKKGTELELDIEAPCLECARCGSKYLPSEQCCDDEVDVINEVISQELIIPRPMTINRIVTLTSRIILLAIPLIVVGALISRSVANRKADEIMRPAFDEGWARRTTWLSHRADQTFQPMWVVEYENTSTRVLVDFGPKFGINLFGTIIYVSPRDLVERIRTNKLRVEQTGPPDETNRGNAEAHNNRGLSYDIEGQYDQAISDLTKALEINPRNAAAYFKRAFWYGVKGQHDQAILDYTKSLEINPRVAATYSNRGVSYDSKGQHDQAILDYTKALEIDPSYADAYNNRGIAYFHKREYEKSWEDVEKAQSLGHQISPKFLDDLRKASGRKE